MKTWPTGEVAGSKEQGVKRKLQLREEGRATILNKWVFNRRASLICARLKALAGLYLASVIHVGTTDVQGLHHGKQARWKDQWSEPALASSTTCGWQRKTLGMVTSLNGDQRDWKRACPEVLPKCLRFLKCSLIVSEKFSFRCWVTVWNEMLYNLRERFLAVLLMDTRLFFTSR